MDLSEYRILYCSELAQELSSAGKAEYVSSKNLNQALDIPLQHSFFEDMSDQRYVRDTLDHYETGSFFVHQPQSRLIQSCFLRTGYGVVAVDDCVIKESLFHFPWFRYPQFRINGFQEDGVVCILPNSPPDIDLSAGFSVCSGINENYYHWLVLFLGRLSQESLQSWADEIHCKPTLIFPVFENELQRDSASVLANHYKVPFLSLSEQVSIKTKNLVMSEPMRSGGLVPHPMIRESLDVLKKHYFKNGEYPKKIYISRRDTNNRKILNEALIEEAFINRGYQVITLAGLSLSEQVNYFAHAKKIVGPHGAGLTNICFSEPDTKVLEIQFPNHLNWCYRRLAAVCNLDYQHIFSSLKSDSPYVNNCTFEIDIVKVMLCFEHGF